MSSAIEPHNSTESEARFRSPLSVSRYERAATIVIALLVIFGTAFAGLAVIFFADKFGGEATEPIAFVPMEASSPTGNGGVSDDPEPPGIEDAPELSEPALQDTLSAVASTTAILGDALVSEQAIQGTAEKAGRGSGLGDARQPGPGGDGVIERVPRWQRWKIRFEPQSLGDFSAWLDQYGVRVGVLGRDNKVHVAWDFADGSPNVEVADPKDYNAWGQTLPADGPMPALTNQLARQAGTAGAGRIALLFFPFAVEQTLYPLEAARNKSGDANKIRETIFTVVKGPEGYKFVVIDQKYF